MNDQAEELRSMTGYGRAETSFSLGRLIVTLSSVNRRHLELHCTLPKLLSSLENEVRKQLSEKVARGRVNCVVEWRREGAARSVVRPNLSLAVAYQKAIDELAEALSTELPLDRLLQEPEIFFLEEQDFDEQQLKEVLVDVLGEALNRYETMRKEEGRALLDDLSKRAESLEQMLEEVIPLTAGAVVAYRERLKESIESVVEGTDDERVLREVALFADRIDITEEITRFKSHLAQLRQKFQEPRSGKGLDFVLQELFREVNTMGSKATSAEVISYVVEMKCEIEKMREQVQNIE